MSVGAGNLDECYGKLAASDRARAKGGKVVALTIPMSFPVRLSFRSGFVLDAMPGWESVMLLPLDEKLAYFSDAANSWRTQGGSYRIYVGTSSRNLPLGAQVRIGGRQG